ncbi:hypothetical protein Ahy_A10g050545 isoform B [Arachis hypogaea]|nr:hypothetical protein Ahy_A10g050545 isoform B [Arachis hypogaea]
MDNTGMNVAEGEGAMVTSNDKTRNPSNQSPQNKPTPVNTIDISNPPINQIPPTNPTPPTKPESLSRIQNLQVRRSLLPIQMINLKESLLLIKSQNLLLIPSRSLLPSLFSLKVCQQQHPTPYPNPPSRRK